MQRRPKIGHCLSADDRHCHNFFAICNLNTFFVWPPLEFFGSRETGCLMVQHPAEGKSKVISGRLFVNNPESVLWRGFRKSFRRFIRSSDEETTENDDFCFDKPAFLDDNGPSDCMKPAVICSMTTSWWQARCRDRLTNFLDAEPMIALLVTVKRGWTASLLSVKLNDYDSLIPQ
jgi:hypothetical protein